MNIIATRGKHKMLVLSDPETRMGFIVDRRTGLPGEPMSVDAALKFGYWEATPGAEVKHGGPGVHSTGTPQAVHGRGGGDVDPLLLREGGFERRSVSRVVDYVEESFKTALGSGELSAEPLDLTERALALLPVYADVARRDLARNPTGNDTALRMLREYETIATEFNEKRIKTTLGLALIADLRAPLIKQQHVDTEGADMEDMFVDLDPKAPARFKKEVEQQVVAEWAASGATEDEVLAMMAGVGSTVPAVRYSDDDTPAGMAARMLIQTWAATSNDGNPTSLAVQERAADEFPMPGGAAEWRTAGPDLSADAEALLGATLTAMHARTQRWFEGRGISEVTLYRGQHEYAIVPGDGPLSADEAEAVGGDTNPRGDLLMRARNVAASGGDTVRLRPMSSWSLSQDVANGFSGHSGTVMEATVPVERILAHPRTGFGCLSEDECVVLGGTMDIEWTYTHKDD